MEPAPDLRRYGFMILPPTCRFVRTACLLAALLTLPAAVHAGTFPFWGLSFGTPARATVQLGASIGDHIPSRGEDLAMGTGPVFEAAIGLGGGKIGVGHSLVVLTDEASIRVVADLKAVAIRSWDEPRGASRNATYLGAEGGLSVSFVRLTVGLAKRLAGRPSGANVLLTWGAGVQIRMGKESPRR